MKLSTDEKQSFVGPAFVGCALGTVLALAQFAFASEYAPHSGAGWSTVAISAFLGFLLSVVGSVGVFSVLPLLVRRALSKGSEDV
jgi:hypothetical protein